MSFNRFSAITSVINLVSAVGYQELLLIDNVNQFFNIDHDIFLVESSTDIDRFVKHPTLSYDFHDFVPRSIFTFGRFGESITTSNTLKEIKSKDTFLIVASEESDFKRNANLFTQIKEIQRLNVSLKIGLFFGHILARDVQQMFEWCWNHRIVNIFVAFYSNYEQILSHYDDQLLNIFNYSPFGTFDIINVTGHQSVEYYFPNKVSNFQQHPIRMGIYDNIWLFQYSLKSQRIGGPDGKLWKVVLQHVNASFTIIVEREQLWQMLKTNVIDVVAFSHRPSHPQLTFLYPMNIETEVIAVPEARPFPEFIAYLRSITSETFFGYSFVTILTVLLLLMIIRYIKQQKIVIFQCAADVLNLLMNDNGYINYRHLSGAEGCLIVPLTFTGFVIVNGILSSLQSYVTRPIMESEINTVEDIYKSPLPILIVSRDWLIELPKVLGHMSNHDGWTDRVYLRRSADLLPQIFAYNTSLTVLLYKTHVNVLLEHQKRLNIRGYHIPTEFYILKFLSSYHVNNDFPFSERFNDIIQRLQSAGLYEKWTGELYGEVKSKAFSINRSDYIGTSKETEIDSFPIPKFIVYGWIVGVIILVFEIVWKRMARVMFVGLC